MAGKSKTQDELLRLRVFSLSQEGLKTQEIANKIKRSRQWVSGVLNSKEAGDIVVEAKKQAKELVRESMQAVMDIVKDTDPDNASQRLKAALAVLKTHGIINETKKHEHSFPQPTVIRRKNGEEVVLGYKETE